MNLPPPLHLPQLRLRTRGPPSQRRDLRITPVGRLASARLAELLQRPVPALLAPVRQMRRVQALALQQLTDLTRPGARVGLSQDPRLVLRAERAALGLLDQLRIRRGSAHSPRAAARFPSLAYGSLGQPGRGSTPLVSIVLRHPNKLRISPSRSIDP